MKRKLAEAVVASLRLSGGVDDIEKLRDFAPRDWQRSFRWLDDSGLALYLLQRLKNLDATDTLSPEILAQLEGRLVANRLRWEHLAEEFDRINKTFERSGIPFAVVKGLALVPDYCPDAVLRAPSDLDYLLDKKFLPHAQQVLEADGYRLVAGSKSSSSYVELKFGKPSPRIATISDCPYSVDTEPLVELHFGFWNHANGVPLEEPIFPLERAIPHSWQGLRFPVLNARDSFLVQIMHIFQHTLEYWVKLCWLLEIGFFMSRRLDQFDFWRDVDVSIQVVPHLAEFAAVVIGLSKIIFDSPSPDVGENWMRALRAPARLWLETHARRWIFDDHPFNRSVLFPTTKLALFLHQEYLPNHEIRKQMIRRRLLPWKRPPRVAVPIDHRPMSVVTASQQQWRFVFDRIIFHAGSSLRYLWEVPRWRQLTNSPLLKRRL